LQPNYTTQEPTCTYTIIGTFVILIKGTGSIGTKIMTNSDTPRRGNKRREKERKRKVSNLFFL
jgi:hypothetical protein